MNFGTDLQIKHNTEKYNNVTINVCRNVRIYKHTIQLPDMES